jgi:uncharacterized 2Fe-2S/4Fe-4S cluster protein (DUF4445 family)
MNRYKVTFLPERKMVEVDEGPTIFQAAEKAGAYLNSLCGGQGVCGKCKVQVIKGQAKASRDSMAFLSKEELRNGYVLACQTHVTDNLEILIPPESRLEEEQILGDAAAKEQKAFTESKPISYSKPDWVSLHKRAQDPATLIEPLTAKVFLELPEPTADDNIPDTGRIERAIRERMQLSALKIPLNCLRELSGILRSSGWKITVTLARMNHDAEVLQIEPGDTSVRHYGIAVDVGTTSVVSQLVHLKTGNVLGVQGSHNLQAHYGEDVLSRIAFACGKGSLEILQKAVAQNINEHIETLTTEKNIDLKDINCVVASGNTTMSHLLLGLTPCSIRNDPYVPTVDLYPPVPASEAGIRISPHGILHTLPSISSYVGGDTVAGVLACNLADRPETTCLIDVGTNGEIVIGNNTWMLCCSASAGPAFEGGDIRCGMRATRGAIQKVNIEKDIISYDAIGKAKPRGICGSGLIDLIYELARNGLIDIDGRFRPASKDKRLIKMETGYEYIVVPAAESETGKNLVITQTDIDNIVRSKGAIFAAIKSLTDYAGLKFDQLEKIFIAGGFGNYLNIEKAIGIGLIPDVPRERIEFVGNSSLMGARMTLLSLHNYDRAVNISKAMTNIELSKFGPFSDEYMASLYLPHIDRKTLFPSVTY